MRKKSAKGAANQRHPQPVLFFRTLPVVISDPFTQPPYSLPLLSLFIIPLDSFLICKPNGIALLLRITFHFLGEEAGLLIGSEKVFTISFQPLWRITRVKHPCFMSPLWSPRVLGTSNSCWLFHFSV